MAAFHGSTRGHGLRVEEHDHRAGFDEIVQRDRLAVLIEQLEVVNNVTFVHGYSQTGSQNSPLGALCSHYGRNLRNGFDPAHKIASARPQTIECPGTALHPPSSSIP